MFPVCLFVCFSWLAYTNGIWESLIPFSMFVQDIWWYLIRFGLVDMWYCEYAVLTIRQPCATTWVLFVYRIGSKRNTEIHFIHPQCLHAKRYEIHWMFYLFDQSLRMRSCYINAAGNLGIHKYQHFLYLIDWTWTMSSYFRSLRPLFSPYWHLPPGPFW